MTYILDTILPVYFWSDHENYSKQSQSGELNIFQYRICLSLFDLFSLLIKQIICNKLSGVAQTHFTFKLENLYNKKATL